MPPCGVPCLHCSAGFVPALHCSAGFVLALHCSAGFVPALHCSADFVPALHCSADFKAQLLALHRELVANVLELVTVLVDKPSLWARQVRLPAGRPVAKLVSSWHGTNAGNLTIVMVVDARSAYEGANPAQQVGTGVAAARAASSRFLRSQPSRQAKPPLVHSLPRPAG